MSATDLPEPLRGRWEAAESAARPSATASAEQNRLLAAVLAGLPKGSAVTAEIQPIPSRFRAVPEQGAVGTAWLEVTARSAGEPADNANAAWLGAVIAGAFREASHILGLPDLLGKSQVVTLPDGQAAHRDNGLIAQPFGRPLYSPAEVKARISTGIEKTGIACEVAYLESLTAIPLFTLESRGGASGVTVQHVVLSLLGNPRFGDAKRYEAYWATVKDDSGHIIHASGRDILTGSGNGTHGTRFGRQFLL